MLRSPMELQAPVPGPLLALWRFPFGRHLAVGQIGGEPAVVSVGARNTLTLWDPTGSRSPRSFAGHAGLVWAAAVGWIGQAPVLVSGGGDSTVRVWNVTGDEPPIVLAGHVDTVRAVSVGTVQRHPVAVSGGDDRTGRVWDLTGGGPHPEAGPPGDVRRHALGPSNLTAASPSGSGFRSFHAVLRNPQRDVKRSDPLIACYTVCNV